MSVRVALLGLVAVGLAASPAHAELSAAQARYDRDGSGALEAAEAPPAVALYFKEADVDGSGGLDRAELDGLARQLTLPRKGTPDPALKDFLEGKQGFAAIDAFMEKLVADLPLEGAGIFVARGGKLAHQATFGIYDPDTVVPIASASKWLAAATVMSVVEEGLLDLDTPISAYWDEATGEGGTMTLRTMLSHTAGTGSSHLADQPRSFTLEESARGALALPRVGKPGEKFQYGGVSLQIAGYLATRATGKTWAELFQERIAGPLGMSNTWFGFAQKPEPRGEITNPILAAGVYSSLADYSHFLAMLAADGVYEGRQVLKKSTIDEMAHDYTGRSATLGQRTSVGDPRGYGFGEWCDEFGSGDACLVVNSGGAFGVLPRLDRRDGTVILLFVKDRMGPMRPYWTAIIGTAQATLDAAPAGQ
ncbi:MAG: beta-lactamase family protein [Alphaproteobacteria bacterium]|nr:beta-lactamase family protein [Alphaproteobacteria bacterium]